MDDDHVLARGSWSSPSSSFCSDSGSANAGFLRKQCQLFARKLLALASRFGLEQLPEQALGAIQLRRQIHNDFLQCFWIAGQRLGIDGQAQV